MTLNCDNCMPRRFRASADGGQLNTKIFFR